MVKGHSCMRPSWQKEEHFNPAGGPTKHFDEFCCRCGDTPDFAARSLNSAVYDMKTTQRALLRFARTSDGQSAPYLFIASIGSATYDSIAYLLIVIGIIDAFHEDFSAFDILA